MDNNNELLDEYLVNDGAEPEYVRAGRPKRLGTYVIDYILITVVNVVLELFFFFQAQSDFFYDELDPITELKSYFVALLFSIAYYTVFEYFLNGKTIGKMVTKTKVVRRYGGELNFWRVVGRSAARFIPFEAFSIFFNEENLMWHDSLSDTMVVEDY